MGREFVESGLTTCPAEFKTRFSADNAVVQAAVEVASARTGLYEIVATAVEREIDDTREVRRTNRRPSSVTEIHVRQGTAIVHGEPYPVRIFRQAIPDSGGRRLGRVFLVLFDL